MNKPFTNPAILERFDELIREGVQLYQEEQAARTIKDHTRFTQWTTSCFNLLDKLSASTNRFVTEFELHGRIAQAGKQSYFNVGFALGVLKSAKEEYIRGLAIDYHLSVSASVFSNLLDEARYLLSKGYLRASAVITGAALEEGLKTRAHSEGIELDKRDGLADVIIKLKKSETGILTEFEAKKLEPIGKIRNDAAHGSDFNYKKTM